jgi:DNA transposition AAA+ family ATPase
MNSTTDKLYSDEEQDQLRESCRDIMAAEGLSQADLARESATAMSTFSSWFNRTYKGDNNAFAAKVRTWLSSREEQKKAAAQIRQPPDFVMTKSVANFIDTIRFAHVMRRMIAIVGVPGLGKTVAANYYVRTNPNAYLATMDPSTRSVNAMLHELAATLWITESGQQRLARAIGNKLRATTNMSAILIVDEGQNLDLSALDMLRSYNDRYGVGIAVLGNESIVSRIDSKAHFAQLSSRVSRRVTQSGAREEDIQQLIKAWDITDRKCVAFLHAVAKKPGALRSMTLTLEQAHVLAAGENVPVDERHLKAAYGHGAVSVAA